MTEKNLSAPSFFPFWADVARTIVRKLISPPKDLELLEGISKARSLYDTLAVFAVYQPISFKVLLLLCASVGLLVPSGAAFAALRFMGRCNSQRIQEISPSYTEVYNCNFVALSCLTVTFMLTDVMLVGYGINVQRSVQQASTFYDGEFQQLGNFISPWNGNLKMPKRLREAFKEYVVKKMNHTLLDVCLWRNCTSLEEIWRSEKLWQIVKAQRRRRVSKLKGRISFFQKRRSSLYAPLMNVTAVVVGLAAFFYVVALTLGMLNHDKGMAPTERNVVSHLAGLVMLYNPVFMFLTSVMAVPLAVFLLIACIVGECYFCGADKALASNAVEASCDAVYHSYNVTADLLHSAFLAFAKEFECGQLYKVMDKGLTLVCGSVLPNYHGAWLTLLSMALLLVAAIPLSLRMSKFYLVMDQYRYVGWDDQLVRKPPRRRQFRCKRTSF